MMYTCQGAWFFSNKLFLLICTLCRTAHRPDAHSEPKNWSTFLLLILSLSNLSPQKEPWRNTAARSLNASLFERSPCLPIRCSLHIGLVSDYPFTACVLSFPSTFHVKQQIAYKLLHHLLGQVKRQDKTKVFGGSECARRVCTRSGVWGTTWQLQQLLGAWWWNFLFLSPSFHSAFWLLKLSISFFSLFPCQLFSIPSTCFSAFNSRLLPCEMLLSSLVEFLLLQVFFPPPFSDFHCSKRN